ncbi:hypothetical protein GCM10017688_50230 [Streptomyces ramulosus]
MERIRTAPSVRVRLERTGSEAMRVDLRVDRGGSCTGRIISADGAADVIKVRKEFWLKPDEALWKAQFGGGSAAPPPFKDRYLHGSTRDEQLSDTASLCDLAGLHRTLAREVGSGPFAGSDPVDVDGRQAETASGKDNAVQISMAGRGEPIRILQHGEGTVTATFTDRGKPVHATAPPPERSVDLDRLR